mgnify:CR=1 FL=1
MNKKLRTFVYPVCAFIVLLLLWQVCVMLSTSEIAFPTPVAVFKEFFYILTHKVGNYYTVVGHVLWSLSRVLVGFSIAAVFGIILGLTMGWFDYVRAVMMPIFNLLRPIAPLAWIPLAILWFGIGFQSKAFLVFLFSVFTILYNTVTGAKECKKEYLKVAKVFKANRSQTVFLVIIPAALPSIFNGLKLAAATALTGVLFSEMQSARAGLGYLLTESQNLLNTPRMFFLIILITLLSVGAVKLIDAIEYAISYRWRHV